MNKLYYIAAVNQGNSSLTQALNRINAKVFDASGGIFVATDTTIDNAWINALPGNVVGMAGGGSNASGGGTASGLTVIPVDTDQVGTYLNTYPTGLRGFLTSSFPALASQAA